MNRNRWIAFMAGTCALAIVSAQSVSFDRWMPPNERDANEVTLFQDLRTADDLYREYMRADSLLPLLPDTTGIRTMLSPLLPRADVDRIHARIEQETAEIGDLRARLGVFIVGVRLGRRPGVRVGGREIPEIYVGSDSAGAYCAMIFTRHVTDSVMRSPVFDRVTAEAMNRRRGTSVLGPCAFIAKHGAPGAGIAQWLSSGGYRFAALNGAAAREFEIPSESTRWSHYWAAEARLLRGCRGGRIENCAAVMTLVTRTAADRQRPATYRMDYDYLYLYESGNTRTLLYDLEQQFGPDRFARFWSSELDMPAAFTSAFGTDPGTWVQEWTGARWDPVVLGARVEGVSILLSVLCVGIFGIAAMFVAVRRQV